MNRLFIVRHGNTFDADEPVRRVGARTDLSLSASGVVQAHALRESFRRRGVAFTSAMTGPLLRTRQTAALILEDHDPLPLTQIADWLVEIDHGPDEGMPEASVARRLGADAIAAWEERAIAPEGWVVEEEQRRLAWRRLLAHPPSGDMLIVTSNGMARFALLEAAPGTAFPLKLRTGAFGVLEARTGGNATGWDVAGWDLRQ